MIPESLTDLLVSSYVSRSEDRNIKATQFLAIKEDYSKILSSWGKACFIHFITINRDLSIRASGEKLLREVKQYHRALYDRYISVHLSKIKRRYNSGDSIYFSEKLIERVVENNGLDEVVAISRAIYSYGDDDLIYSYLGSGINLTLQESRKIKTRYK